MSPIPTRCLMLCCVLALSLPTLAAQTVTMAKRGNVRFGPSTEAPVITTLDAGTQVTILGKAPGRDGWYQIQFPRQGHAWMHEVVLAPTSDPRVLRVTRDQASVRSDARIKSELVDQLSIGETVEWVGNDVDGQWRGRKVGGWYAVYPASAVAYVHRVVLDLGRPQVAAIQERQVEGTQIEAMWQSAQQTYRDYREQLARDPDAALDLDWHGLAADLKRVVEDHPTFRTKLMAKKMYAGIQRLLTAVQRARSQQGLPPVAGLPDVPDPATTTTPSRREQESRQAAPRRESDYRDEPLHPGQESPADSQQPVAEPVAEEPDAPAAGGGQEAVSLPEAADALAAAAAGSDASQGWLVQKDVEGADSSHVLIDENSEVSAVVVPGEAFSGQLSEYFWRRVAVSGASRPAVVTIDGVERQLPLITATDVRLVR